MPKLQVEERVITILAREFDAAPEQLSGSTLLIEHLRADSLALTNLVLEFEGLFKIHIPDEDFKNIKTVDDVIRCIERFVQYPNENASVAQSLIYGEAVRQGAPASTDSVLRGRQMKLYA